MLNYTQELELINSKLTAPIIVQVKFKNALSIAQLLLVHSIF